MVHFLTVLSVSFALVVSQVFASAGPLFVRDLHNHLEARQGFNLPTGSIPQQCQSQCSSVVNALSGCSDLACMCSNKVGSGIQSCMTCGINQNPTADLKASGQAVLDQFTSACKSAGYPINSLTLGSTSGSSNAKTSGAIGLRSGMAMGAGALGAVVGALSAF